MRYKTSRLAFLPELKEVVCKCLGSMKCDGYIIGFNNYGGKSELIVYGTDKKEVANLGDIFQYIDDVLQEVDAEKNKLSYTFVLSVIQQIIDYYKEKVEEVTKRRVIYSFPNRISYLVLIRAFLRLVAKVENKKVSIDTENSVVKIDGVEVYSLNYDMVNVDTLLQNLFYDFVKIIERELRS